MNTAKEVATHWFITLGPWGTIAAFTVYAMLADRGILPKFWLGRKNGNSLNVLLNNHIEHL